MNLIEASQKMAKNIGPDDTIVFIGGYNGKHIRKFYDENDLKTKQVYIVEPEPRTFSVLEQNCPEFKLRMEMITNRDGVDVLYVYYPSDQRESSQANSIYKKAMTKKSFGEEVVEIKPYSCTMETFIEREKIDQIRFLYINCEGGEYKIFNDPKFLSRVDMLHISMHGKLPVFQSPEMIENKLRICNHLWDYGFDIFWGTDYNDIPGTRGHINQIWMRNHLL